MNIASQTAALRGRDVNHMCKEFQLAKADVTENGSACLEPTHAFGWDVACEAGCRGRYQVLLQRGLRCFKCFKCCRCCCAWLLQVAHWLGLPAP